MTLLQQIKQSWEAFVVIIIAIGAGFTAAVVAMDYFGLPERVDVIEVRSIDNRVEIERNREDFEAFLDRFDQFLCLRDAADRGIANPDCVNVTGRRP